MLNEIEKRELNRKVGWQLKKLRLAQGMPTVVLAGMLGRTEAQIRRYEDGSNPLTAVQITQCARIFRVAESYFYQCADEPRAGSSDEAVFRIARVVEGLPKEVRNSAFQFFCTIHKTYDEDEEQKRAS